MKNALSTLLLLFSCVTVLAQKYSADSSFGNNGILVDTTEFNGMRSSNFQDMVLLSNGKFFTNSIVRYKRGKRSYHYKSFEPNGMRIGSFNNNLAGAEIVPPSDAPILSMHLIGNEAIHLSIGGIGGAYFNNTISSGFNAVKDINESGVCYASIKINDTTIIKSNGTQLFVMKPNPNIVDSSAQISKYFTNVTGIGPHSFTTLQNIFANHLGIFGGFTDAQGGVYFTGRASRTAGFWVAYIVKLKNRKLEIDSTFGKNGLIEFEIGNNSFPFYFGTIDKAGNFYLSTSTNFDGNGLKYNLIKFNSAGFPMTSFAENGILNTTEELNSIAFNSDNNFIAPNQFGNRVFAYTSEGKPWKIFGDTHVHNAAAENSIKACSFIYTSKIIIDNLSNIFLVGRYEDSVKFYSAIVKLKIPNNNSNLKVKKAIETSFVYPNPASEALFFSNNAAKTITVINAQGQVVLQQKTYGKLSIADLPKGVYLIQCQGYKTQKIIKN